MKKTFKLLITLSLVSATLPGCGSQSDLTPDAAVFQQLPVQNVTASSRTPERGKIIARKKRNLFKPIRKNSGGSYEMTLRFEYNGSIFTPAGEDVSDFMQRYGRDIDDWELEEIENTEFDQLGKRRYRLTIYGPDRARLDYILSSYRDHLRSLG